MIKTYRNEHTCIKTSIKTNATLTWMTEKLESSLKANPRMSNNLMFNELNNKYGVQPHPMQLYRAREKVIEEIKRKHSNSF